MGELEGGWAGAFLMGEVKNKHFLAVIFPIPESLRQSPAGQHTAVPVSLPQVGATAQRGTKMGGRSTARLLKPPWPCPALSPSPQAFAISPVARSCGRFPYFLGITRTLNGEEGGCFFFLQRKKAILGKDLSGTAVIPKGSRGLFPKVYGTKGRAWPQHTTLSLRSNPEVTKKTPLLPLG